MMCFYVWDSLWFGNYSLTDTHILLMAVWWRAIGQNSHAFKLKSLIYLFDGEESWTVCHQRPLMNAKESLYRRQKQRHINEFCIHEPS